MPARQNSLSAHVTPSQAERGVQVVWQAEPAPQLASQGTMSMHVPRDGSQNWPSGQSTPSQATGRQPAKHVPPMHVSSAAHVTPAQGSTSATHWPRQRSPSAHGLLVAHGSGWQ